ECYLFFLVLLPPTLHANPNRRALLSFPKSMGGLPSRHRIHTRTQGLRASTRIARAAMKRPAQIRQGLGPARSLRGLSKLPLGPDQHLKSPTAFQEQLR